MNQNKKQNKTYTETSNSTHYEGKNYAEPKTEDNHKDENC